LPTTTSKLNAPQELLLNYHHVCNNRPMTGKREMRDSNKGRRSTRFEASAGSVGTSARP
jgi:hypothetical protein